MSKNYSQIASSQLGQVEMVTNECLVLSVSETAARLGISRGLCYQLAKEGRLPVRVLHLGRRMVVPRRALEEVLSGTASGGNDAK